MTDTMQTQQIDPERVGAFVGQVVGGAAATMTTALCALGDKLGLFKTLAAQPGTSRELAARAGLSERYVREWATGLVSAGYLAYDPKNSQFSLPPEHALVLAAEGGPAFLAGVFQMMRGLLALVDPVEQAFRDGGGIPITAYGDDVWIGLERLTGPAFVHHYVQEWIAGVSGLDEKLRAGASVADIGCNRGFAAITLARAYPQVRVVGIDSFADVLEDARAAAVEAGVADRVSFAQHDAVAPLSGTYDLITIFDVVHEIRDPLALLRNARDALARDGVCLILEPNGHEHVEEAIGVPTTLLLGMSLFHCLPQSLADGGPGLGGCGSPEGALRNLCEQAGFSDFGRVWSGPIDSVFAARV